MTTTTTTTTAAAEESAAAAAVGGLSGGAAGVDAEDAEKALEELAEELAEEGGLTVIEVDEDMTDEEVRVGWMGCGWMDGY